MVKYAIWYEDGKYDHCGEMTAEEVIAEYCRSWKKVVTVTTELYENGKYLGEVDTPWEEFCKGVLEN